MNKKHISSWPHHLKHWFSFQGKILVGTKDSEFLEINEKTGAAQMVTCGHGEGELWGLTTHPSTDRFVTASEDGTVRQWDIIQKVSQRFDQQSNL